MKLICCLSIEYIRSVYIEMHVCVGPLPRTPWAPQPTNFLYSRLYQLNTGQLLNTKLVVNSLLEVLCRLSLSMVCLMPFGMLYSILDWIWGKQQRQKHQVRCHHHRHH